MDDNFEAKSEYLYNKLISIIDSNDELKQNREELIYALSQLVADKISLLETSDENKGAIVSGINDSMKDFFRAELIFYRERLNNLEEQKSSTLH